MKLIYVDEKGPQNTFRKSVPFDMSNKLKIADDNMNVYAANVIMIDSKKIDRFERGYKKLENNYLKSRKQFSGELKGQDVLENKFFEYGIASMRKRALNFYQSLFDLLLDNQVENLFFTISKMSIVIDSKLNEWILDVGEEYITDSSVLLKYTLTKYALIEASEKVIDSLLDEETESRQVLKDIRDDMEHFINKNLTNQRMVAHQLPVYRKIIDWIDYSLGKMTITESDIKNEFNWDKFMWAIDLWLTEMDPLEELKEQIEVNLDEGILAEPFEKLNIRKINEDSDSEEHIGLRATDMVVVMLGKMISILSESVKYDLKQPEKAQHLSKEWFDFDKSQYKLIQTIDNYIFPEGKTYVYGNDTYFDDGVLLQTYIMYVAHYNSFKEFRSVHLEEHVVRFFEYLVKTINYKYKQGIENEKYAIKKFGSYRTSILKGIVHPL